MLVRIWHAYSLLLLLFTVNAAIIPVERRSWSTALTKRAVVYADTGADVAKSSVCSDDQKKVLESTMLEVAKLAKAGSDGLAQIISMASDDKSVYDALTRADQNRVRKTYWAFFGRPKFVKNDNPDNENTNRQFLQDVNRRASAVKTVLDRIKDLNDTNPQGKRVDQLGLPPPTSSNKVLRYDYDLKSVVDAWIQAQFNGENSPAGFTTDRPNNKDEDRIAFNPQWFVAASKAGPSFTDLDPAKDIQPGFQIRDFRRKAGRIFLHEHLHTWTFNQYVDKDKDSLGDVEGSKSYGPENVVRIGEEDLEKASKNIESVVYWSIAMFYSTWDWSDSKAQQPKA